MPVFFRDLAKALRGRFRTLPLARRDLASALAFVFCFGAGWTVFGGTFTPRGTQPPLAHALESPGSCSFCHGDFAVANNEPYPTWAGSMMANASRDPLFWAALDVANNDVPGIGEFCLRCHTTTGWLAGRAEPPGGSADGCGLLGDIDSPDTDFSGVSCHLCHRMMINDSPPPGEQSVYYENGDFWIDDGDCTDPGSGPCRRGPYDYPGGSEPPHQWAFSQYHVDSDMCGNCHNVTSPAETLIDENGVDTGIPYPIERTFKEWQQSDFSDPMSADFATCQNCHMEDTAEDPAYACAFEEINRAGDMAVHRFAGGNTWIPAVLRDEYPNLGRADSFNATIAWALDMLQNRSAELEVFAPGVVGDGGTLEASVRVTNLTGHKLPTGYVEGRRMWIHLEARDGNGVVFFESGAYDDSTGVLTEDAQVKIYQSERGIWNRNGTNECDSTDGLGNHIFHFVLNNCIVVENRIPPKGFTGGSDPETRPVGYTYPETSPGSGILAHWDDTTYQIPVPPGTVSPISLQATLRFQIASKEYVDFLRDEAVTNNFPDDCITRAGQGAPSQSRGEILHAMWSDHGRSPPVDMEVASRSIAVTEGLFEDGFESGDTTAWSVIDP